VSRRSRAVTVTSIRCGNGNAGLSTSIAARKLARPPRVHQRAAEGAPIDGQGGRSVSGAALVAAVDGERDLARLEGPPGLPADDRLHVVGPARGATRGQTPLTKRLEQLDPLIDALVMADQADRLSHLTETDDGPASGAPVKP